ncbi:GntR family transcriptional regulator [Pseudonocardia sp. NPDC046786]|uniref:GntR family transcriptional regulator n=1 Tax=Pseudonocardia sp. NPDC046786 TaxID=3155471 RepID=UPI0033C6419C
MTGELPVAGRRSTAEVYEEIRTMILESRIEPGERINLDALARDLGVSQTPVREAVRHLEGDHLVVRTGEGRGYRTTTLLDRAGLRELFEFRLLVDLWAVRAVAVNRLSNPAGRLAREVDRFERAAVGVADVRRLLVTHDTTFHGEILAACGNDVARRAYTGTHGHLHAFRLYSPDIDGTATVREHRAVLDAIAGCDPDAAEEAMRRHLVNAYHRFDTAFAAGDRARLRVPGRQSLF